MNTELMFSLKTDLWATPQKFFDELNKKFDFTLDPCSNDENKKCKNHFTEKENGLAQRWTGRVFMNPPYGKELKQWIKKAHDEVMIWNADLVVALIPARTDTTYFHEFIYKKFEIDFIKWRLKFWDSKNCAPFPSMLVYFKKLSYIWEKY